MPNVNVRITNLPQIRAAFRRAPGLTTKELNVAIKQSILAIAGTSAENTPVDTGRLRASHFDSGAQIFRNLYGEVGPKAFYGIFVHQGTRFMQGRPFLFNSVKSNDAKVQKFFRDAVQRVLDQIGRGI